MRNCKSTNSILIGLAKLFLVVLHRIWQHIITIKWHNTLLFCFYCSPRYGSENSLDSSDYNKFATFHFFQLDELQFWNYPSYQQYTLLSWNSRLLLEIVKPLFYVFCANPNKKSDYQTSWLLQCESRRLLLVLASSKTSLTFAVAGILQNCN